MNWIGYARPVLLRSPLPLNPISVSENNSGLRALDESSVSEAFEPLQLRHLIP